jgi:hypothetical protein
MIVQIKIHSRIFPTDSRTHPCIMNLHASLGFGSTGAQQEHPCEQPFPNVSHTLVFLLIITISEVSLMSGKNDKI